MAKEFSSKCYKVSMWGCPKPNPNVRYVWADSPLNAKVYIGELDWKTKLINEHNGKKPCGTVMTKAQFEKFLEK